MADRTQTWTRCVHPELAARRLAGPANPKPPAISLLESWEDELDGPVAVGHVLHHFQLLAARTEVVVAVHAVRAVRSGADDLLGVLTKHFYPGRVRSHRQRDHVPDLGPHHAQLGRAQIEELSHRRRL